MEGTEHLHFKRKSGKEYKLVGARSTGWRSTDVVHYVKSIETGKIKEMTNQELIDWRST